MRKIILTILIYFASSAAFAANMVEGDHEGDNAGVIVRPDTSAKVEDQKLSPRHKLHRHNGMKSTHMAPTKP